MRLSAASKLLDPPAGEHAGESIDYRVSLSDAAAESPHSDAEPDDRFEDAVGLEVGRGPVSGTVGPGDPADWYRVDARGARTVAIHLRSARAPGPRRPAGAPLAMDLWERRDGRLFPVRRFAGSDLSVPRWRIAGNADLLVAIGRPSPGGVGRHEPTAGSGPAALLISGADPGAAAGKTGSFGYELTLARSRLITGGVEPNDGPRSAIALAPGYPLRGTVPGPTDRDFVLVPASRPLLIRATGTVPIEVRIVRDGAAPLPVPPGGAGRDRPGRPRRAGVGRRGAGRGPRAARRGGQGRARGAPRADEHRAGGRRPLHALLGGLSMKEHGIRGLPDVGEPFPLPGPFRVAPADRRLDGAFTVDVEEYFHVENLREAAPKETWEALPSRVEPAVERILDLLDEHRISATFFTLGWVAERHPRLVARIAARGHEVASHGYGHEMLARLDPERFRRDIQWARAVIEDAAQRPVLGHRAPTWSIGPATAWALDVLIEEGYRYDASIFPVRHDRYGDPTAPFVPHRIVRRAGSLVELPPLVLRAAGANFPAAGGGYLRLLPLWYTRHAVRQAVRHGRPAVLYIRPWEIDADQPRFRVGILRGMRHYGGLAGVERKLALLLGEHRYGRAIDLVQAFESAGAGRRAAAA